MGRNLSIIVPVFNESGNVQPLADEVAAVFEGSRWDWELVYVDDASTDDTWGKIHTARSLNPRIRALRHRKNAGQSAALWTGILSGETEYIATLDGDLQNDPLDLPRLLDALGEVDFACGVRTKRRDSWLRKVSSKVARSARRFVLGVDFVDTGCALRGFRRCTLRCVFPFNGLHRFLPILVHAGGFKTRELPINHRPRVSGISKYGVWNRVGRGLMDLCAMAWYQRRRLDPVEHDELK